MNALELGLASTAFAIISTIAYRLWQTGGRWIAWLVWQGMSNMNIDYKFDEHSSFAIHSNGGYFSLLGFLIGANIVAFTLAWSRNRLKQALAVALAGALAVALAGALAGALAWALAGALSDTEDD